MLMCFYKEITIRICYYNRICDDLNIIGTPEELLKSIEYLNKEFQMKDLGTTKFCLGLQIKHLADGIFVH